MRYSGTINRTQKKKKIKTKVKSQTRHCRRTSRFQQVHKRQVTEEGQKRTYRRYGKTLNKKSSIAIENDQKRIKNLYNALTNDANCISNN